MFTKLFRANKDEKKLMMLARQLKKSEFKNESVEYILQKLKEDMYA